VILGVCAAIVVPSIHNRDDLQTASMARVLMADLAYAQGRAVLLQKKQYVKFDTTNNCYDLLDQITPSASVITHPVNKTAYHVALGSGRKDQLKSVGLDQVSFDGKTVVMFDDLGAPYAYDLLTNAATPLAAGSVRLKCNTYTLTVTVEPYTGELKVN
jgi:hypothetical protein